MLVTIFDIRDASFTFLGNKVEIDSFTYLVKFKKKFDFTLTIILTLIRLWPDFFGPDTFYCAKKSILLCAIYFKNKFPKRPFYLEFS